jgi:hypothetical protein
MLSLKKKSAVLALATGLTLVLASCANDVVDDAADPVTGPTAGPTTGGATTGAPTTSPSPLAALDSLDGKQTAVTLDKDFLAALTSLNVKPAPVAPATLTGAKIAFPITGGNVTYFSPDSGVEPFVQGEIVHAKSGLQLTAGGKVVKLTDFVVDPEESVLTGKVTVDGKVAVESAPLFFLDGSTVNPLMVNEAAGTAVLEGTTVSLTEEAAALLNETFGITALEEFLKVGIAEITLELPKS